MKAKWAVKPSKRFLALVEAFGGPCATAKVWSIEYASLRRFLEGKRSIHIGTVAHIVEGSGMSYEDLFEHVPVK